MTWFEGITTKSVIFLILLPPLLELMTWFEGITTLIRSCIFFLKTSELELMTWFEGITTYNSTALK